MNNEEHKSNWARKEETEIAQVQEKINIVPEKRGDFSNSKEHFSGD
jgi:hypothetical protein